MIDLGSQRGSGLYIIDTSTAVDCTKDVRFGRRSFRSLIECVVPCCAGFPISSNASAFDEDDSDNNSTAAAVTAPAPTVAAATTVTGTFFGHRRGRVRFCVHDHAAAPPLLLLEFTVPTAYLAREMQHGLLRVALESGGGGGRGPLLSTPVWTMYCNGRKVGFAIRRRATEADAEVFRLMRGPALHASELRAGYRVDGLRIVPHDRPGRGKRRTTAQHLPLQNLDFNGI
ncbi:hypothetical protein ZIOFF_004300 [Zingiber officinale]|uniref:Protein MIZU-KUSSEI 1 n=1 Tax=Zingiber officinale TaxID=94328 RepID=A0A8J5MAS3_ZINOF|nr:hypothetical protein ZIOFF_004300 [Zingiber officinale]